MMIRPRDPLHGVTLKAILEALVSKYGWEYLARRININCFKKDPSISSSLVFLRKTPWAREKVEGLYIRMIVGMASRDEDQTPEDLIL
jgi:uncharacterized protein (DUF2132 family)